MQDILNLQTLFEKQERLDNHIYNKHGLEPNKEILKKLIRALKSEFGEAVSKWGGFKFWATKQKYSRDEILEETVDMLHFFLSIGNVIEVTFEHTFIDKKRDVYAHMDAFDYSLMFVGEAWGWFIAFGQYRGLIELWGFDWEKDILPAYHKKYEKNILRQNNGY